MAQLILTIMLDGLMALLLVITTYYCWRLNKRIRILQDSKSELAQIIRQFDESTQRATQSIGEIHEATSRIAENIQHKIDKANYLADDLQFMIEKGSKIADKMEGGLTNRSGTASAPSARSSAPAQPQARAQQQQHYIEEDEEPVRAAPRRPEARPQPAEPTNSGGDKARSSLDSMLKRVSGRKETSEPQPEPRRQAAAAARPGARLRSKAEQELFDALKSGNDKA